MAVILKICVGFWGAAPDPAGGASAHPRPPSYTPRAFGAQHILPSIPCLGILAIPVLCIRNLKLCPVYNVDQLNVIFAHA